MGVTITANTDGCFLAQEADGTISKQTVPSPRFTDEATEAQKDQGICEQVGGLNQRLSPSDLHSLSASLCLGRNGARTLSPAGVRKRQPQQDPASTSRAKCLAENTTLVWVSEKPQSSKGTRPLRTLGHPQRLASHLLLQTALRIPSKGQTPEGSG